VPALLALALLAAALPAQAFNPQPEPPAFGLVGLVRTQSAILNVVLTHPPDPTQPPDPMAPACELVLSFQDASGQTYLDAAGAQISRRVALRGNAAASLQIGSRDVVPDGQLRGSIRAVVHPPDPLHPPDPQCEGLVATLEVVDAFGFTRVLYVSELKEADIPPDPQEPER
jgi:hypothetical protein